MFWWLCLLFCTDSVAHILPVSALSSDTLCPPVSGQPGCVCSHPDGLIDLSPLSNDGTPRFTQLTDANDYTYQFNPCQPFSMPPLCKDVYICQGTTWDAKVGYEIANSTEQIRIDDNGTVYLFYNGPENRETRVYLICDTTDDGGAIVRTDGDSKELFHYVFNLTSQFACPKPSPSSQIAGVVGFSLILLLLLVVLAYLVIGSLIMKCKYKASGSDLIPNKRFWLGVPFLVKDGFLFVFHPCFSCKIKGKQHYEETSSMKKHLLESSTQQI